MERITDTITGPDGIRIELDSAEIFPDDPGAGTPAMVYLKTDDDGELSGTFWCVCDTGEMMGNRLGDRELSQRQCDWLWDQADEVNAFVEDNAPDKDRAFPDVGGLI